MKVEISVAAIHEADTVCRIDQAVIGSDSREGYLTQAIASGNCLVARTHDAVAGFLIYDTAFYGNTFIWLAIVRPDFRRNGVAASLIRYLESVCPTAKLFTSTNESNLPMQRVCESLGFIRSGRIDNLDEGDPEIVYFKKVR